MKTFLKIVLIVALLLVAIKLSPVIFVLTLIGLLAAAMLGAVGFSLLIALFCVVLAVAAALAPIWIPVLLIMGVIALFKKLNEPRPEPPKLVA
jgi:hypothetical protein